MLRILGIQRSTDAQNEFVLLQNQGSLRLNLRGQTILSEEAIENGLSGPSSYVFRQDQLIPPGHFVLLFSGFGESKWVVCNDGSRIFQCYANGLETKWSHDCGQLHALAIQHSLVERRNPLNDSDEEPSPCCPVL